MFTQRIVLTPALGRAAELVEVLSERVRGQQAQGLRASLSSPITGHGRVVVNIGFETLAGLQVFREKNRQDATFQAFQTKIAPLQAKLATFELWEVTIAGNPATPPKYVQRIVNTAAPGQANALKELLSLRVRENQEKGVTCALSQQIASDAPRFGMAVLFASLAEFEARRAQLMADSTAQQFMTKLAALCSTHGEVELSEVLIPAQLAALREMAGTATR